MDILVTGITGQLGYDVCKEIEKRGHVCIGVDRNEMDLTNPSQIKSCIYKYLPQAIIHCGAYTAVDLAQGNEHICTEINSNSVKELSLCAKDMDIPLIYISTDYVFDGTKEGIYNEEDIPNPINVYGKTKYKGEVYIREILEKYYIIRISWVFGKNGKNFIDTMLKLSKEKNEINVINDQIGSPTYTADLAPLIIDMLETDKYGTYHVTNEGFCTWYEFAKEIFAIKDIDIKINPIKTSDYPTKAQRPLNSRLSKEKLIKMGFKPLRSWKLAIKDYLDIK